jgi:hypothetical protein
LSGLLLSVHDAFADKHCKPIVDCGPVAATVANVVSSAQLCHDFAYSFRLLEEARAKILEKQGFRKMKKRGCESVVPKKELCEYCVSGKLERQYS